MKKTPLLHAELSEAIARLGHGDLLVIGDAGLPIPEGPRRIDLALTANIPRFHDVLAVVLGEMAVEGALVAEEIAVRNPVLLAEVQRQLGTTPLASIPHEDFKRVLTSARVIVRSGEFAPYANVVLRAGVVF